MAGGVVKGVISDVVRLSKLEQLRRTHIFRDTLTYTCTGLSAGLPTYTRTTCSTTCSTTCTYRETTLAGHHMYNLQITKLYKSSTVHVYT